MCAVTWECAAPVHATFACVCYASQPWGFRLLIVILPEALVEGPSSSSSSLVSAYCPMDAALPTESRGRSKHPRGQLAYYCYDHGYLTQDNELLILLKKDENE